MPATEGGGGETGGAPLTEKGAAMPMLPESATIGTPRGWRRPSPTGIALLAFLFAL
jgi:hypothetical protein